MNNCSQVEVLTLWNIWEFLIILFESFLFFLFMNRKLDSKREFLNGNGVHGYCFLSFYFF